MKLLLTIFFFKITFTSSVLLATSEPLFESSDEAENVENSGFIESIVMKERAGVRYYKKQKYKLAFENLSQAAKQGLKQSQYLIGIMYLKGQHVEQSLFHGMAWLGVAKESKSKDWLELFDKIYANASVEQQQAISENTEKFIAKYGIKKQHMTCSKRTRLGERKIILECTKDGRKFDIPRAKTNEAILQNRF